MEEHMDMLSGTIDRSEVVYPMPKISLLNDEVRGALGKVKRAEQPGPDRIKGEIYSGSLIIISPKSVYNNVILAYCVQH